MPGEANPELLPGEVSGGMGETIAAEEAEEGMFNDRYAGARSDFVTVAVSCSGRVMRQCEGLAAAELTSCKTQAASELTECYNNCMDPCTAEFECGNGDWRCVSNCNRTCLTAIDNP